MMLDIARGAGAAEVHAIIPYYSYARSDKKDAPRISITARLIADLLETSGATHNMTMTLHSPQVHGFFSLPTDPLTARSLFVKFFKEKGLDKKNTVVVSPDIGRAKPASRFAKSLGVSMAVAQKERITDYEVRFGDTLEKQIKGYRYALVYDDEIATGTTAIEVSNLLVNYGIEEISVICTHGVFTGDAHSPQHLAGIAGDVGGDFAGIAFGHAYLLRGYTPFVHQHTQSPVERRKLIGVVRWQEVFQECSRVALGGQG